ncbi:MAG TPA: HAMP domain-containing sensor histidine kinase, partial [Thermomicrobiaceae bacterium]|nr:HAMP domain-containing sensor histidine kinase [Thermomicrobiaceae bacterium]
ASIHHLALAAAATFLVAILLLSIPALLISIPVGVWRAKAVSRRVERLARAADAMAQGDLTQQVDVAGADEIARLGDRFNMMSASLREADESRRAFVSNVSHDLRTPLAIIQGNVERLIDQVQREGSGSSSVARLESIQTEVGTLDHLVGDLFTLARLDEAVLKVQPKPMTLLPVIREVVDGIKAIARAQQQVSIEIARTEMFVEPLPAVLADELRVRQILANLIYNSLRHTPEGGVILVGAQALGDVVEVSVTDTGVGIAPEELPNVFDRNYRATNHSGFGYREGGGLGLAIVKQLVEAQHGQIQVESCPGEGSVFRFTLPVEPTAR